MQEIERKFLVKKLPPIDGLVSKHYERYILPSDHGKEMRIQQVGSHYELEELEIESELGRKKTKRNISKEEFEKLKSQSVRSITRDSYMISENPNITLKIYHGAYKGLVRAEIEFDSEEAAQRFNPLDWMGKEITDSPLGRDSRLTKLSAEEFKHLTSEV